MRQDRLLEIVGRIYQNPDCWEQNEWHTACRTAHCIAGHAEIDSGVTRANPYGSGKTFYVAQHYLELSDSEASELFYNSWTLDELVGIAISGKIPNIL